MRRIFGIAGIVSFLVLFLSSSAFSADETITITTYYPAPSGSYNQLRTNMMAVSPNRAMPAANGNLVWGDGVAALVPGQGGSIILGGLAGGAPTTPFIDFHRDNAAMFDARLFLPTADILEIRGASLRMQAGFSIDAAECRDYAVGVVADCPAGSYAVSCGAGSCAARGAQSNPGPGSCPQAGYMICIKCVNC